MEILQSLPYAAGVLVALCAVFLFLFWPALILYAAFSALRSLRRIAAASARVAKLAERLNNELDELPAEHYDGSRRGVLNSMFGR